MSPEEWNWLRNKYKDERLCTAGQKMFTVQFNGDFTSCISDKIYGNIFEGIINPDNICSLCSKACPSLVSYPFRCDNDFQTINSLLRYVERNENYRRNSVKNYVDFEF